MTANNDTTAPRPLITIAITCYNAEDTIRRAIMSAIQQTWSNRETIILDDYSTDGSWKVVQDLVQRYPELRAIRHDRNRGVAAARNSLLAETRGQFIAFFDDDDESAADRLEAQYKRITGHEVTADSSFIFCYSNQDYVESGETEPSSQKFGIGRRSPEPYGKIVADYRLGLVTSGRYCWGLSDSCTIMARVENFRIAGGFDESLRRGQDADLTIRAAFKGAHFISVNRSLIKRYWTDRPYKAGTIDLQFQLLRIRKYKVYLDSKGAYLGIIANTHASFYHWKGCHWRGHLWRTAALIFLPWRFSRERLMSRRYRSEIRADRNVH